MKQPMLRQPGELSFGDVCYLISAKDNDQRTQRARLIDERLYLERYLNTTDLKCIESTLRDELS